MSFRSVNYLQWNRPASAFSSANAKIRSMSDTPPDDRSKIDQASSRPSIAAEIFGGLLLIFSICMLAYGVIGVVFVVHEFFTPYGRFDAPGDIFGVSMFLIIGTFSGAFAIGWLRTRDK